jgi:hypothetical protein
MKGTLTKSGLDDVDDGCASVDVRDDLSFSGAFFGTFLEDNNLWVL